MQRRISAWLAYGLVILLSACAANKEQNAAGTRDAMPAPQARTPSALVVAAADDSQPITSEVKPAGETAPAGTSVGEGGTTGALPQAPVSSTPPAPAAEPAHAHGVASPALLEAPASPYIFNVTAGDKDATHPFYGIGSKLGFIVNGVQGKPLVVVRGKTYTFKVDTGVMHDFYFSLSAAGWGTAAYTAGIEGQFIYKGVATFTPEAQTPDVVYYACRNHKNMGGPIYVVNPGEEGKPLAEIEARVKAAAAPAAGEGQRAQTGVTQQQVNQKIQFADMFINQSESAKRVKDSANGAALDMYASAQKQFAAAKEQYARGNYAESLALVDDALRMMSEASRMIPKEAQLEGQRQRFEELLRGTRDYEASYKRNYDHITAKKGKGSVKEIDLNEIHLAIDQAQTLANDGQYPQAIGILSDAQTTLTTALTALLDEESITYEQTFATPQEEYEYELSRYLSYEELVPLAIEQKQPPKETVDMMNQFVNRAKEIKQLSDAEAAKENYKEAILMLQGATDHVQRALHVVGVR